MEELDIWRTAKILIDAHGEGAELEAAVRADVAISQGNAAAESVWKRVGRAVITLRQQAAPPGTSVN